MNHQPSGRGYLYPFKSNVICICEAALLIDDTQYLPVSLAFHYAPQEPYTVRMLVSPDGAPQAEWVFARDLLAEGLTRPAGLGDVQVWPAPHLRGLFAASRDSVHIWLSEPEGDATLAIPTGILQSFLEHTYIQVAPGTESQMLRLDEGIAWLVADKPEDGTA